MEAKRRLQRRFHDGGAVLPPCRFPAVRIPKEVAMNRLAASALILVALLAFPSGAEAKMRPTVDGGSAIDCFNDMDTDPDYSEGIIVSCCYDDGCWICEHAPGENCVWDSKYRVIGDVTVAPGGIGLRAPKMVIAGGMNRTGG
jgi:hypothetical protein